MGVLNENAIMGASGVVASAYSIDYSCRFDGSAPHMLRTPGSAGNRRIWTLSVWVKRANLAADEPYQHIFTADQTYRDALIFDNADKINVYTGRVADGGSSLVTTAVYRDTSSWYHIVWAVDTTQGTAANRSKLYVNGSQVTSFSTETYMNQNWDTYINNTQRHSISYDPLYSRFPFSGYLAEMHFIDGTQLTPTSFGETDDTYGHWKPIEVSGLTYSTNGFYMDFADAADLGDDESGEVNDYSETNITASDQTTDSPTNNWAVANRNEQFFGAEINSFSEGNLKFEMNSSAAKYGWGASTHGMSSGKWYCEALVTIPSTNAVILGIVGRGWWGATSASNYIGAHTDSYGWYKNQGIYNNTSATTYGSNTISSGDLVGIALDLDNNKLYFHQNGTYLASGDPAGNSNGHSISAASTTTNGAYHFAFGTYGEGCTYTCNFGQDGTFAGTKTAQGNADDNGYGNFYYDVPAGFLSLNSANLPAPTVVPSEHFSVKLYDDGAGAKTGVGFQPDLVWVKSRGSGYEHEWTDAVRGVTKAISSDSDSAGSTDSTGLTAFGSDGFTVGSDTNYSDTTGDGMMAFCWKGGNAISGTGDFTQGSIASTCSRNVDAGFSIVSYTGAGVGTVSTVGHGLSQAPELVITKDYGGGGAWQTWAGGITGTDWTDAMRVNTNVAPSDFADWWNDTAPSATVVTLGGNDYNNNSRAFIMYCWHSVEGYSKVGHYIGNGNDDGSFIYCGFEPAFLIVKTMVTGQWAMFDNKRIPTNPVTLLSKPSTTATEENTSGTYKFLDFLSNGFKFRLGGTYSINLANEFFYIAFAERPFSKSNAR